MASHCLLPGGVQKEASFRGEMDYALERSHVLEEA